MHFQHVIQLIFYHGSDKISAFWCPPLQCFTLMEPRAMVSHADLTFEMSHAEHKARDLAHGGFYQLTALRVHFEGAAAAAPAMAAAPAVAASWGGR